MAKYWGLRRQDEEPTKKEDAAPVPAQPPGVDALLRGLLFPLLR